MKEKLFKLASIYSIVFIISIALFATGCFISDSKTIITKITALYLNKAEEVALHDYDTIEFNNLILSVNLKYETINIAHNSNPFINSVYATSLPEPTFSLAEKITDIRIISKYNYNNQIQSGTDFSNLCSYRLY